MGLKEADKAAKALKKTLDNDCRVHGARNAGDTIDTGLISSTPIKYFDLKELVDGYTVLRKHQKKMKKMLASIKDVGEHIKGYELDEA
ncbi:MAG: hypothetical protein V3U75_04250 [Methylococcaceae bacterium]